MQTADSVCEEDVEMGMEGGKDSATAAVAVPHLKDEVKVGGGEGGRMKKEGGDKQKEDVRCQGAREGG